MFGSTSQPDGVSQESELSRSIQTQFIVIHSYLDASWRYLQSIVLIGTTLDTVQATRAEIILEEFSNGGFCTRNQKSP